MVHAWVGVYSDLDFFPPISAHGYLFPIRQVDLPIQNPLSWDILFREFAIFALQLLAYYVLQLRILCPYACQEYCVFEGIEGMFQRMLL